MLLRRSTDIYPKELAPDMRQFFNSLLGAPPSWGDMFGGAQLLVASDLQVGENRES